MNHLVPTPAATPAKRQREQILIANLKRAWSVRPGDENAQLRDRRGQRLTFPDPSGTAVYVQRLRAQRGPTPAQLRLARHESTIKRLIAEHLAY